MGLFGGMTALTTIFVAGARLAAGRNFTVAEVEDCIFIHCVCPFSRYRSIGIGTV
jgi:hypothetical protein